MKNQNHQNTFGELFNVILNGNKEDSRKAARKVRKLLYHSPHYDEKFKDIKSMVERAPERYLGILEDWRKENFVVAVSVLYYLHGGKKVSPDSLFPWLFDLLLHKNGNIRQSAVRMINTELGPLTFHIRCPEYKHSKSKIEQFNTILLNLFISLNNLLDYLWEPKYKKYKYISSLPACPYKSVQMVLSEMEDSCGGKYMQHLKKILSR